MLGIKRTFRSFINDVDNKNGFLNPLPLKVRTTLKLYLLPDLITPFRKIFEKKGNNHKEEPNSSLFKTKNLQHSFTNSL